jgi:hypothetical protein
MAGFSMDNMTLARAKPDLAEAIKSWDRNGISKTTAMAAIAGDIRRLRVPMRAQEKTNMEIETPMDINAPLEDAAISAGIASREHIRPSTEGLSFETREYRVKGRQKPMNSAKNIGLPKNE